MVLYKTIFSPLRDFWKNFWKNGFLKNGFLKDFWKIFKRMDFPLIDLKFHFRSTCILRWVHREVVTLAKMWEWFFGDHVSDFPFLIWTTLSRSHLFILSFSLSLRELSLRRLQSKFYGYRIYVIELWMYTCVYITFLIYT